MAKLDALPAATIELRDGLEIGPQGKDAQHLQAGRGEARQIVGDLVGVPVGPHARAGVAGPVVAADDELAGGEQRGGGDGHDGRLREGCSRAGGGVLRGEYVAVMTPTNEFVG